MSLHFRLMRVVYVAFLSPFIWILKMITGNHYRSESWYKKIRYIKGASHCCWLLLIRFFEKAKAIENYEKGMCCLVKAFIKTTRNVKMLLQINFHWNVLKKSHQVSLREFNSLCSSYNIMFLMYLLSLQLKVL